MSNRFITFFFLCFAFLLTRNVHAETDAFKKAQRFFFESKEATLNYLKTGKGLNLKDQGRQTASKKTYNALAKNDSNFKNTQKLETNYTPTKAFYFSVLSNTVNDQNQDNPDYGLSVAISVPVYTPHSYFNSEFQFSGDIKNAGDWGQVQVLQKEALSFFRNSETHLEFFVGMGFGYGHGERFQANQRFYAPWATGIQLSKINREARVFYRFELGWTGDFFFLDNNYNQGLLANVSLGYKL